jgi:hypothetical protein
MSVRTIGCLKVMQYLSVSSTTTRKTMRHKDTIRLTKQALKQPWLYTNEELTFMRKAKRQAKKSLKIKQMMKKNDCQTDSSDTES